jgi:hypothetical protein
MDAIDSNYIFWYCSLDEGFNQDNTGFFVDMTVPADPKGEITLYKQYKTKYMERNNEEDRDDDDVDSNDDNNDWEMPSIGEVGWMSCTRLERGQILIAFYDDYGDDGQIIVNEFTSEIEEYLNQHSFDNDECRRRSCRLGDAFYSFAFDWEGNVIYESPLSTPDKETEEHYDLIRDDKCSLLWKPIQRIHTDIYHDRKFEQVVTENKKEEAIEDKQYKDLSYLSLCDTLVQLKTDTTSLFYKLPRDIFNLLYNSIVKDYQTIHFIPFIDPIIPSYSFFWNPANQKENIFFTTPIDNDKIYISLYIEKGNNKYDNELIYLKGDITIKSTNNEIKILYMMILNISLENTVFSFCNNGADKLSLTFSSCIYVKITSLDKIKFNIYYNV